MKALKNREDFLRSENQRFSNKGILFLAALVILATLTMSNVLADGSLDCVGPSCPNPKPIVTLISPNNGAVVSTEIVQLTCSAQSNDQGDCLKNITLFGNWGSGWRAIETKNINGTGPITVSFNREIHEEGNYKWNCRACDVNGGCSYYPVNYTFILDLIEPDTDVKYFTQYNETYNPVSCDRYNKAYADYDEVVGHGISSDLMSNLLWVRYRWDTRAYKTAYNLSNLKTELWFTDWNDYPFTQGWHKLCGWARDFAGHEEVPDEDDCCDVCVDMEVPSVPGTPVLNNPSNCNPNYISEDPIFSWTASSDQSGCGVHHYEIEVYYSNGELYGTYDNVTETLTFVGEDGKDYYVRVRAWDNVGKHSDWSANSSEVFVDKTNPIVEIIAPEEYAYFRYNFEVSENDSDNMLPLWNCSYKIGSGSWIITDCNENITVRIPEDCSEEHCIVSKQVFDQACNSKETNRTFHVDRTPPVTNKTVGELNRFWNQTFSWMGFEGFLHYFVKDTTKITLTCSDTESGCGETYFKQRYYDGSSWTNWSDWTVYNDDSDIYLEDGDGVYDLRYYSVDVLGNEEEYQGETDKVDTEAPTTIKTLTGPKYPVDCLERGVTCYITSQTILELICQDDESGCLERSTKFRVTGEEDWTPYTAPLTFGGEDGAFLFEWYSQDYLLNNETVKNETDYLDNNGPRIDMHNPVEEQEISCGSFTVTATIDDGDGVGIDPTKIYAYLIDDATKEVKEQVTMHYNSGYGWWYGNFQNLEDAGVYIVMVSATDLLGNKNTMNRTVELVIDMSWAVLPESYTLNTRVPGTATFNYDVTMCHGGDSIAMRMEKLCCQYWLSPILFNGTDSALLGELFSKGCSQQPDGVWNFLKLKNFNPETRTGQISLNMSITDPLSRLSCSQLDYQIAADSEHYRDTHFDVTWGFNTVTFTPEFGQGINPFCGDELISPEIGEECEGTNFGGLTCASYGYNSGSLSCNACQIDNSSCYNSGTGGGGGSGGGSRSSSSSSGSCTEKWQCTPYGSCINNWQFRTCTDMDECGTTKDKPTEKQACETATTGSSNGINGQENANNGNNLITGNAVKASPVAGVAVFALIVALAIVVTVVVKRVISSK